MALLYDNFGNQINNLDKLAGDLVIDTRPAPPPLAAVNAEVFFDCSGTNSASIDVRGTFSATLITEATVDGTNYFSLPVIIPTTELWQSSITLAGVYLAHLPSGCKRVRVRCSAFVSGSATVILRGSAGYNFLYAKPIPANFMVTATAAGAAAVSLNIPAVVGLHHYICSIQIVKFAAAALIAAATPVVTASANISGAPIFSFGAAASAQGTYEEQKIEPCTPLKSTSPNVITTISCPATTGVIWRLNVVYYAGA